MKNKLKNIYKNSQNLFHTLHSKIGGNIDPELDLHFASAIENGGLEEIDFKRPEGQSYNPRPARIAIILMTEAQQVDQNLLIAAFNASSSNINNEVAASALKICNDTANKDDFFTEQAKLLALALHLDRARHFHLSPSYLNKISRANFHMLTYKILQVAGTESNRLNDLIVHWLNRDEKKLIG